MRSVTHVEAAFIRAHRGASAPGWGRNPAANRCPRGGTVRCPAWSWERHIDDSQGHPATCPVRAAGLWRSTRFAHGSRSHCASGRPFGVRHLPGPMGRRGSSHVRQHRTNGIRRIACDASFHLRFEFVDHRDELTMSRLLAELAASVRLQFSMRFLLTCVRTCLGELTNDSCYRTTACGPQTSFQMKRQPLAWLS